MMKYLVMWAVFAIPGIQAFLYANESTEVQLECPGDGSVRYWILHGKGIAYEPDYFSENITVSRDGVITFKSVEVKHEGTHLCMTENAIGPPVVHEVFMRVKPKPSENPWKDTYQRQFLTGLIAAVIFAILFAGGCIIYSFRWKPSKVPHQTLEEPRKGVANPALSTDDEDIERTNL